MIEKTVTEIETLAPRVAAEHGAQMEAIAEERAARVALLARVLEIARPALRAVCQRIRIGRVTRWHGNVTTSDEDTWSERRYLALGVGPGREGAGESPHDNAGEVTGWDLYLRDDGDLHVGTWSGSWSRWQGAGSEDALDLESVTCYQTVERTVADGEDERVISALADALRKQAGKRDAQAPRDRAKQIAAVAALLGGVK